MGPGWGRTVRHWSPQSDTARQGSCPLTCANGLGEHQSSPSGTPSFGLQTGGSTWRSPDPDIPSPILGVPASVVVGWTSPLSDTLGRAVARASRVPVGCWGMARCSAFASNPDQRARRRCAARGQSETGRQASPLGETRSKHARSTPLGVSATWRIRQRTEGVSCVVHERCRRAHAGHYKPVSLDPSCRWYMSVMVP
jgi:hypothetical protein